MAPVRVLIVDDQAPFRQAAAAVVTMTDRFVMVGAIESGEACIAAVPELRPDLVLMDISLPGIDGIEAAAQLSAMPEPPVVVLISTYPREEFADGIRTCGAAAFIDKSSFGPEMLAAAWASVCAAGMTAPTRMRPSAGTAQT